MVNKYIKKLSGLFKNVLFRNSGWGIISQFSQTILLSLFFVILARQYSTAEFSRYIVATVLYQLITAFSSMGLSQWFIREIAATDEKKALVSKFLKVQACLGLFFYVFNICIGYLLYDDQLIRLLSVLVGVNIVFDNIINAIKCLNIANFEQQKTFVILTLETVLKFLAGCLLFIYSLNIVTLSIILTVIRILTLNLFVKFGSSSIVDLKTIWRFNISLADTRRLIFSNWPFIVISGVSIINWRMANIFISKLLTAADVANYEISYKIFSIAQIFPIIISTTVFPLMIKLCLERDLTKFRVFYRNIHLYYMLFGLISFTFIYSFADFFVPWAFGAKYASTAFFTKQMFLTILVFPTAFLQANVLISMRMEKMDMLFNIIMMCINISVCFFGLYYFRSLSVANYSIFISFIVFHFMQDLLLIKNKIASIKQTLSFYLVTIISTSVYMLLYKRVNQYLLFLTFWALALTTLYVLNRQKIKSSTYKLEFEKA